MPEDYLHIPARLTILSLTMVLTACKENLPRSADSSAAAAPTVSTAVARLNHYAHSAPNRSGRSTSTAPACGFTPPEDTSGMRFPPNAPTPIAGDTLVWMAELELATVHVRIWPEQCSDVAVQIARIPGRLSCVSPEQPIAAAPIGGRRSLRSRKPLRAGNACRSSRVEWIPCDSSSLLPRSCCTRFRCLLSRHTT